MTQQQSPLVLVVDDHQDIRESLVLFLTKNNRRALAVDGADSARRTLRDTRVDLVILDIMMPGEDGLSLCRFIRETLHIPVILLSARGEDVERIIGLEIGADDYMAKPFNPRELLARIDAVLRRTHALPPAQSPQGEALRFERWTLNLGMRELIDEHGRAHELSTGEFRMLMAFLERPKIVLSREQLLDLAFDRGVDVFDRAVDTQVSRLRRKIERDPRQPRLIKTVWGGGYVFTSPVEKA